MRYVDDTIERLKVEIRHIDPVRGEKYIARAVSMSLTSCATLESCLRDVMSRLRRGLAP